MDYNILEELTNLKLFKPFDLVLLADSDGCRLQLFIPRSSTIMMSPTRLIEHIRDQILETPAVKSIEESHKRNLAKKDVEISELNAKITELNEYKIFYDKYKELGHK